MITRIEIENYRLLNDFSADLNKLNVVIGTNAVGKSTLIDCLQLISQCAEFPINTVLGWHWGIDSLRNVAANMDKKLSWRLTFRKPDNFWMLGENRPLVYEVALQADAINQATAKYELLRSAEPYEGYDKCLKYLEATQYRKHIYNHRTHGLDPFDETSMQGSDALPPINGKELPSQAQEPTLMLSHIRFFNEFPVPSAARFLLANMTFYPGFDITRYSALRTKPAEIKTLTTLSTSGDNLGTVLHELLTRYEYRSYANDLRDFLKAAYPTFEEIHCDTTYGTPPQVLVRVREKGMRRSMELWEISDGMLRFLCLATALLDPNKSFSLLVAVDEPEAGFHPRLLPIVGDMIKTASEQTQVLVTTHSPDLLNQFDIADIAVMTRDDIAINAVWHRPNDRPSLLQMLENVKGETLGDLHRSGELDAL